MRSIAWVVVGTTLLASCSSGSALQGPSPDQDAALTREVDAAVQSIDDHLATMASEEVSDPPNHVHAVAFRENGIIRKIVEIRASDDERSTTHYFFAPDGMLIFAGRTGNRYSRNNGQLDTVTSLDGAYYLAGSKLTPDVLLHGHTQDSGDDHDVVSGAASALKLFEQRESASAALV